MVGTIPSGIQSSWGRADFEANCSPIWTMAPSKWVLFLCIGLLFAACEASKQNYARKMGSTSAYPHPAFKPSPHVNECELVHATMVFRHGARNPPKGNILAMSKLEDYLQRNPGLVKTMIEANPGLSFLQDWRNPFADLQPMALHPTGMEQLYEIAKRLREGELRSLVDERGYVTHRHRFTSSQTPRTIQSAQVYSTGFFYDDENGKSLLGEALNINYQPKNKDWPLRFFEACEKFRREDKGGLYHNEHDLFRERSIDIEGSITDAILARLGLEGAGFDKEHVGVMHRLCAYEASLDEVEDRFCSVFTEPELEAYEYHRDLAFYWSRSHGNQLGKSIAAKLLGDILDNFDSLLEVGGMRAGEPEVAHFMFGHAETIVPLLSLMGLYDEGIEWRHDTPRDVWIERKFKSRDITPFSSNVGLLLYRCGEEYFVRALHNEVEVNIPGCNAPLCTYQDFKSLFQHIVTANLHEQCFAA